MIKILIIEDTLELREEINDWFHFEGYETIMAGNGREGVELAFMHLPDLIICDIMMPEMDGNAVLEVLRNNPSTQLIPFVFITALAERHFIRAGMNHGADDYVTKPFTREELLSAVSSRLDRSLQFQKKQDDALNEMRISLMANLPHELKTPLNGILGFGQMLMDSPELFSVEDIRLTGETIHNSASRLFRLIQNYLLFAQLELARYPAINPEELQNPAEKCNQVCVKTATKHNRENDLEFIAGDGTLIISLNELDKITEELADNAFKFSSPGTKVTVQCGGFTDGAYQLIFRDQGCGMSPENLKRIGAYVQFDRKVMEQQGSGLGLVIAKRLVHLCNGTLDISSEKGLGTTIKVTFRPPW